MVWNYSNTAFETTLSSGINAVVTSITVGSVSGLPVSYPYTLVIDPDNALREAVTVASAIGTVLTVTRGVDGTSAASHSSGATVVHAIIARDVAEPQAHMAATGNVHGVGASATVVGHNTAQTLTNKTISGASNTLTAINGSSLTGFGSIDPGYLAQPIVYWQIANSDNSATLLSIADTAAARTEKLVAVANSVAGKGMSVDEDFVVCLDDTDLVVDTDRGTTPSATVGRIYSKNSGAKPALILDRATANTANIQEWRANATAIATLDKDAKLTSRAHIINQIASDTTTKLIDARTSGGTPIFTVDHTGVVAASAGISGTTLTSSGLTTANSLSVTTTSTLTGLVTTTGGLTVGTDLSVGGIGKTFYVRKTSDETVNNTTTLQDDDVLLFAAIATAEYDVDIHIMYDTGTTPDIKLGFTGPASSTFDWHMIGLGQSATGTEGVIYAGASALAGNVAPAGAGAGTVNVVRIRGLFKTAGTSGNFKLQWAQFVANVSNTVVKAGSYLIARRMA